MNALIDISTWEDDRMADYGGYTRKCGKIDENGTRWMVKFEKKHSFKSAQKLSAFFCLQSRLSLQNILFSQNVREQHILRLHL